MTEPTNDPNENTARTLARAVAATVAELDAEVADHANTRAALAKLQSDLGAIYRRWGTALQCDPSYSEIDAAIARLVAGG